MSLELTKKEYNKFLEEIPLLLKSLENKVKNRKHNFELSFNWDSIETIENYFKNIKTMNVDDIKEFWAFVGEALRYYVGGEYRLAPKSEDVAFTPIIVNYGIKEKWKIRLSPEVWRYRLKNNTLDKSLSEHIKSIDDKYGDIKK